MVHGGKEVGKTTFIAHSLVRSTQLSALGHGVAISCLVLMLVWGLVWVGLHGVSFDPPSLSFSPSPSLISLFLSLSLSHLTLSLPLTLSGALQGRGEVGINCCSPHLWPRCLRYRGEQQSHSQTSMRIRPPVLDTIRVFFSLRLKIQTG